MFNIFQIDYSLINGGVKMSWGGAREGAGRKKAEIPKKIRGMRVTDDEWAFLKNALDMYRSGKMEASVAAPVEKSSQV